MTDFLELVFSNDFVPRHHCGAWAKGWAFAYGLANYLIFKSYFLIGVLLVAGRFQGTPDARDRDWLHANGPRTVVVYALFILTCGMGHLLDGVMSFFKPMYHLWMVWHWLTALISMYAVWITFKIRRLAAYSIF